PASPSSSTSRGYRLEASSTGFDGSGTVLSSATPNVALASLVVAGLLPNTTYSFRAASFNRNDRPNYATAGSTSTLASAVAALPAPFLDVFASSVTANWAALPGSPSSASARGYRLEASSTAFDGTGGIVSSATTNVALSTLTVTGLEPNTTYFFRAGGLNWSGVAHYVALGSTSTLADAPGVPAFGAVLLSSVSVSWSLPSGGARGFRVDASSTNFDGSGTVLSSATPTGALATLAVPGLLANTTYFFRAGAVNANGAVHYAAPIATATLASAPVQLASAFLDVFPSSIAARWAALPASPQGASARGYLLEASSTNFAAGAAVVSSATQSLSASTLTVTGLAINTTYYFRVGSLNPNGAPNYTVLSATSSLANAPANPSSTFTLVGVSSIAAQWLANSNPGGTRFELQLSTASDFSGTPASSVTFNLAATIESLTPDTTYYARARGLNHNGVPTPFTSLASTVALASQPGVAAPAFSPVEASSLTVLFASGSPANPAGTLYHVELSSFSDFSAAYSSDTRNLAASFTGLSVNTTYYAQVRAAGASGFATPFTSLGSTATLSVPPGVAVSTFSALQANGFVLSWSSGSPLSGYNSTGTLYVAEISTASDFSGSVYEAVAVSTSVEFGDLLSKTTFFARVRAVNYQNIPTAFTPLGSTRTADPAEPEFLLGTFEVSDAAGNFIDPSLYTDTTTPHVRVRVQGNFAPGLSVGETPSQAALWHLNEGSGSTSVDESRHDKTLTLTNSPAWIGGKTRGGLGFNGSSNYAVSASLVPWRNSAANNQWSVSLWFRSTLGRGFLFQVANSPNLAAGTYDAELSWHDANGNLSFEVNKGNTRNIISAGSTYADGDWHFVTAVLNPSGMFLYVDGALAQSGSATTSINARTYAGPTHAWIGAASEQGNNMGGGNYQYFPGDIDEVMISTVALSAKQISQLYAFGSVQGHELGAPSVDVSTSAGADLSWVRRATATFSISGSKGTTAVQVFVSSATPLRQTDSPGAQTNQVMFFGSS
ncbi:MAG: hypothetical protein HY554_19250, partial [Elusimicrobia bacterium]|nr:hypothetical protein [Elusimicrobiota bacterium]